VTTEAKARCGIYEDRPKLCRDYPQVYHYIPDECTYWFAGAERVGNCECGVGACCSVPREGGEPGGAPLPDMAGGLPCKHLVWNHEEDGIVKASGTLQIEDFQELYRTITGDDP